MLELSPLCPRSRLKLWESRDKPADLRDSERLVWAQAGLTGVQQGFKWM